MKLFGIRLNRFLIAALSAVLLTPVLVLGATNQNVGYYNRYDLTQPSSFIRLGDLSAEYQGEGQYQAVFDSMSEVATLLDTEGDWEFRWLTVIRSSTVSLTDSNDNAITNPHVSPPAGGYYTLSYDANPFWWDDGGFPTADEEGVRKVFYSAFPAEMTATLFAETYLVLTNQAYPKTIFLLENGSFEYGHFNNFLTPTAITKNIESNEDNIIEALENSGFTDWDVVPTCRYCDFAERGDSRLPRVVDQEDENNGGGFLTSLRDLIPWENSTGDFYDPFEEE